MRMVRTPGWLRWAAGPRCKGVWAESVGEGAFPVLFPVNKKTANESAKPRSGVRGSFQIWNGSPKRPRLIVFGLLHLHDMVLLTCTRVQII